MKYFLVLGFLSSTLVLGAESLVRLRRTDRAQENFVQRYGGKLKLVSREGDLYKWTHDTAATIDTQDGLVEYIAPNRTISLLPNPSLEAQREALARELMTLPPTKPLRAEKPEIQNPPGVQQTGPDPLLSQAWGIFKVGADVAWEKTKQGAGIVVAVTDTGVDYNHADLIRNMWRNPSEIAGNGVDDDNNGYVDDLVGWDFALNDAKPFDVTKSLIEILFSGGNPGHGTHVAGVIAAARNNAQGTAGVAPQAKIMALRFITEEGKGTTEHAIRAIDYAVANGAHVINASWGGEAGSEDDRPLKEAIERAQSKGVLFVAAAGNGRLSQATMSAVGFDNDTDAKPILPASYPVENIIAVAAANDGDTLAPFSNWGKRTVKLAAPGVKILSTVPGSKYQDTIVNLGSLKVTWDGTSMAAPFVAGAAAVIWSENPSLEWVEVKEQLLRSVTPVAGLQGKVATDGRLNLK